MRHRDMNQSLSGPDASYQNVNKDETVENGEGQDEARPAPALRTVL